MKILVFGSTGGLGTAIEKVCRAKGIGFVGLGHEEVEIDDAGMVERAIQSHMPAAVVNSAAMIGINPCEADPAAAFNINAIPASYMARFCRQRGIIFVQPSSHAVFDGTKDDYYTEEDAPHPMNMYSFSKYMAEVFTANLCDKYYIIRFPTMFGSRRNKRPGFVDKVIEKIYGGEEIRIAADKKDSMTYLSDAAERLIWMLEERTPYGTYHVANSGMTSYYAFVKKLLELLDADNKIIKANDSDFPALGYKPLKTAMRSVKLPPMRPWEEALSDYVKTCLNKESRDNV